MTNTEAGSFHVEWDSPDEANAFWLLDRVHCPTPITRLDYHLRMCTFIAATNRSNARFGLPLGSRPKLINSFVYNQLVSPELDPAAVPALLQRLDDNVRAAYVNLERDWTRTWLPEIQSHLGELSAFDLAGASLAELCAHSATLRDRVDRLWELHNDLLIPSLLAMHDFEDAYVGMFPDSGPLGVFDLLAGLPNKTMEANLKLWQIGRDAAQTPTLRASIVDGSPAALQSALQDTPEGQALRTTLAEYLRVYGERNDDLYVNHPTWIEEPSPVLRGLRVGALTPERDLAAELTELASRREARLTAVRQTIASHPRAVVQEFERLLAAAQMSTILTEDHHFWIDCKITHHIRRFALELGRRCVQHDLLDAADDVFHLGVDEIVELGGDPPVRGSSTLRARIAPRKAELARFAAASPPMFLGVPRPFLPMDCAVMRVSMKFSGNLFQPPGEPGAPLVGMPASSGKVVGPARLIADLADTGKLRPGDIAITAFTLPSWTPFFATIAGIVTNIGGMLCHAAVVAREYRIPAVVGTVRATEAFTDGQMIEVDGDAGLVRAVAPDASAP